MAQGKLKVKTKVPEGAKSKKSNKNGPAFSKRANKPLQPKKRKEEQKLKQMLSKNLNKILEEEIRSKAYSSSKKTNLSKAQKATANHNTNTNSSTATS